MASEFTPDYIGMRAYLMTDPELSAALEDIAKQVLNNAESISPDRSGEYRDSLFVEKHVNGSRMSWRVGSSSFKAWWIEYGTKHMPKLAVLRRALDSIGGTSRAAADYAGIDQYNALNTGTAKSRALRAATRARKTQLRKESRG